MKILHITNWYPSAPTPSSAPWIKEQIGALSFYAENTIFHVEIKKGPLKFLSGKNTDQSSYLVLYIPLESWRVYEILSSVLVCLVLFKNINKKYDLINFHIVYPNCSYLNLFRKWIKCKILYTEHWSGYHYNFNVKRTDKLQRIRKIFNTEIPVIAVSSALAEDIRKFSGLNLSIRVVSNVVDTDIFNYYTKNNEGHNDSFFMISQWKWPKDPFAVIEAWNTISAMFPDIKLIIAGYGPQWEKMIRISQNHGLSGKIDFVGQLHSNEIAKIMNESIALIHISEYETFSVVCAESICCGTPVIASNVGGIKDFINHDNGILINNKKREIIESVEFIIKNKKKYNRENISKDAVNKFNKKQVGYNYFKTINDCLN